MNARDRLVIAGAILVTATLAYAAGLVAYTAARVVWP